VGRARALGDVQSRPRATGHCIEFPICDGGRELLGSAQRLEMYSVVTRKKEISLHMTPCRLARDPNVSTISVAADNKDARGSPPPPALAMESSSSRHRHRAPLPLRAREPPPAPSPLSRFVVSAIPAVTAGCKVFDKMPTALPERFLAKHRCPCPCSVALLRFASVGACIAA
jgi:hypothetical protein